MANVLSRAVLMPDEKLNCFVRSKLKIRTADVTIFLTKKNNKMFSTLKIANISRSKTERIERAKQL